MKTLIAKFKYLTSHHLAKSSGIVFFGNMFANVSAYLYHLVVGRILGPKDYSELAAIMSLFFVLNVPSVVLQIVLTKYFSIFKAKNALGQTKHLFMGVTIRLILFGAVGLFIAMPFFRIFSEFLHIPTKEYFLWLYLILFFQILFVVNQSVLQGYQKFTVNTVFTNIVMLLRLIFGAVFAFISVGWTLIGNVLSNAITYGLVFLSLGFFLKERKEPLSVSKKGIVRYSIPTLLATLGITALYSMDVVLVKHYFPAVEAGIYSALSVLGRIIFFATLSIAFVIFPVLAERNETDHDHKKLVRMSVFIVSGISVAITLMYFLMPKFIVRMLYGTTYDAASSYLGIFGIFMSFVSLSNLLINIFLSLGKTTIWLFSLLSAGFQIILYSMFHSTIYTVIMINCLISGSLFMLLLLYYLFIYERAKR